MRSITGFVFCFLSTLLLTMADPEAFVGKWKLIETYDEEFHVVELPTGDFTFNLQPDESTNNVLNVFIKVGNSMRSQITFVDETEQGDVVSLGSLMSTMMMPAEPLFRLGNLPFEHVAENDVGTKGGSGRHDSYDFIWFGKDCMPKG